jgi:hypothetical protein
MGEVRIVACSQPTYLPWAGLFHRIGLADVFVVMDTVAFSRKGWQNRNRVKGRTGWFWLTVPLSAPTLRSGQLRDIRLAADPDRDWQRRHWESLRVCYGRAPYWSRYAPAFEELYLGRRWTGLVELNLTVIELMCGFFGIGSEFVRASQLGQEGRGSRLVLDHCRRTGSSAYVSGVNGHDYLVESEFLAEGISVFYQRYRSPVYRQRFGGFTPDLSALDLLFNVGPGSGRAMLDGNVTRDAIAAEVRHGAPVILETLPGTPPAPDGVLVRERASGVPA